MFFGEGAGSLPAASAVVGDVIEVARRIQADNCKPLVGCTCTETLPVRDISDLETRYYVRMHVADKPGVLAATAKVLGDHGVSLASVIQQTDAEAGLAELVYVTHLAREADVRERARRDRGNGRRRARRLAHSCRGSVDRGSIRPRSRNLGQPRARASTRSGSRSTCTTCSPPTSPRTGASPSPVKVKVSSRPTAPTASPRRWLERSKRRASPSLRAEITCANVIPLRGGLGSSSAAIVGGLLLGERLAGADFGEVRRIELAAEIEGHPDNIAAALLGGFTVCWQESRLAEMRSLRARPRPGRGRRPGARRACHRGREGDAPAGGVSRGRELQRRARRSARGGHRQRPAGTSRPRARRPAPRAVSPGRGR